MAPQLEPPAEHQARCFSHKVRIWSHNTKAHFIRARRADDTGDIRCTLAAMDSQLQKVSEGIPAGPAHRDMEFRGQRSRSLNRTHRDMDVRAQRSRSLNSRLCCRTAPRQTCRLRRYLGFR